MTTLATWGEANDARLDAGLAVAIEVALGEWGVSRAGVVV
jgi:hypothetical protein